MEFNFSSCKLVTEKYASTGGYRLYVIAEI